ncbi:hypothetical protein L5515_012118 [Caenorhabditis briggsae]|uniref:Uncharacterized protein n=2 Tax=Caenorhabditis briggsae TaxID=6238 RepID=A0AAE9EZD7_CAEBR|nr:hypothetical protein L5515_012118 [Caenorhabditis briggsae]
MHCPPRFFVHEPAPSIEKEMLKGATGCDRQWLETEMRFVFKASREEIVNATSLQDVKTSMADEYKKMSNLVIRVGVRRMVYETMGMFMNMTDEIRLR